MAAAQIEPGYCLAGAQTALAVLQQQQQQTPGISLSASSLDSMLQGGVKPGTVTEFYGVPGVGKTQLGIQLAVNVQVGLAPWLDVREQCCSSAWTSLYTLSGTALHVLLSGAEGT